MLQYQQIRDHAFILHGSCEKKNHFFLHKSRKKYQKQRHLEAQLINKHFILIPYFLQTLTAITCQNWQDSSMKKVRVFNTFQLTLILFVSNLFERIVAQLLKTKLQRLSRALLLAIFDNLARYLDTRAFRLETWKGASRSGFTALIFDIGHPCNV